jgi:hypothetical protein
MDQYLSLLIVYRFGLGARIGFVFSLCSVEGGIGVSARSRNLIGTEKIEHI